jgi:uncharacterized protein
MAAVKTIDKSAGGFRSPTVTRIAPFAAFMACIAIEEGLAFASGRGMIQISEPFMLWLYLPKLVITLVVLLPLWPAYTEIRLKDFRKSSHTLTSLLCGVLVFGLWINMDWTFGFQSPPRGFNPASFSDETARWLMIGTRIAGAVVVVPVIEELFWRSWLLRYLIKEDFTSVAVGSFSLFSFLAVSLLFGLEHHFILAGIMAGVFFNAICYVTKSIAQCILAHMVANLLLAGYVLSTGKWLFW